MTHKVWMFDPDSGGVKIPEALKADVRRRIEEYAVKHFHGRYTRLDVRFRGQFCYVDAFVERVTIGGTIGGETREQRLERLRNTPVHLCRLRHLHRDRWTCGFYKYSDEKYELCVPEGADGFFCTPEQGFATAATVYLAG